MARRSLVGVLGIAHPFEVVSTASGWMGLVNLRGRTPIGTRWQACTPCDRAMGSGQGWDAPCSVHHPREDRDVIDRPSQQGQLPGNSSVVQHDDVGQGPALSAGRGGPVLEEQYSSTVWPESLVQSGSLQALFWRWLDVPGRGGSA